jgi:acylphosphatase
MLIHKVIKVRGKVQGVFFRASTKEKALELGVKGIVRNEPDGSVYIEAEANSDIMEVFIQWCHKGPAYARVDEVLVNQSELKNFSSFEVIRY